MLPQSQTQPPAKQPPSPDAKTIPWTDRLATVSPWTWLAVGCAAVLLLFTASYAWSFLPDSRVSRVRALQKDFYSLKTLDLPEEERKEKYKKYQEALNKLPRELRPDITDNDTRLATEQKTASLKRFFTLSDADRLQILDREIDRDEDRRKEREEAFKKMQEAAKAEGKPVPGQGGQGGQQGGRTFGGSRTGGGESRGSGDNRGPGGPGGPGGGPGGSRSKLSEADQKLRDDYAAAKQARVKERGLERPAPKRPEAVPEAKPEEKKE